MKKRFIFGKSKGMNNLAHILVRKSGPLKGNVKISGAKNAVLPVIAATLLADGVSTIKGVPDLRDVHVMSDLLRTAFLNTYKNVTEYYNLAFNGEISRIDASKYAASTWS